MSTKTFLDTDVYNEARKRIETVFDDFQHVYVAFSGGKDSGVLLNLALEVARERGRLPLDAMLLDLEGQYQHTVDFVRRVADNPDVRLYWCCLPIKLHNAVSQIQPSWLCWDPENEDIWARPMPEHPAVVCDEGYFDFFRRGMEFEEFTPDFGEWYSRLHGGETCAALVAIRSAESLNRYRTIKSETKTRWKNYGWTTLTTPHVYNCYPIYDWTTEDIWTANGKYKWDYNRTYDLMHLAGVSLHDMRLCQPFGIDQRQGLWLFKILEPDTWARLVNRVQGANFGNRHVQEMGNVMGNIRVRLPEGYTWKRYAKFLLATMPPYLAEHYRGKIAKFLRVWRKDIRAGKYPGVKRIYDAADPRLEADRKAPSWRRICKVLLKNDYWCKGLSFAQTKRDMEKQLGLVMKYMDL